MTRIEAKKVEYIKTREDLARVILDLVMFFQQGYEMEIDLIAYQDRDAAWVYEVGSTAHLYEDAGITDEEWGSGVIKEIMEEEE